MKTRPSSNIHRHAGQNSRNSPEIHQAHLLRKASRVAASNDAIIARGLESLKLAADSFQQYSESAAQMALNRVSYRRRMLERHGVQPDAPIHDQLSADLAAGEVPLKVILVILKQC